MSTSFMILGSGQDGGAPQVGNRSSVSPHRTASCVAVMGPQGSVILLDATPDLRSQSYRLLSSDRYPKDRETFVDGVFVTHAHMGHYSGLVHFGNEAAASDHLPLLGTERFLAYLASNEPWATLLSEGHLEPVAVDTMTATIDEHMEIEAISVPHRDEFSDTVAFSISIEGQPWLLYLPDIDTWDTWHVADAEIARHDVALLDATFSSADELPWRDMQSIGHPLVPDTIERFGRLTDDTNIILTHINHSNPLGDETSEITHQAINAGFTVAYDGLMFESDR